MLNKELKVFFQLFLISALFGSGVALAHPYHSSNAEITWKPDAQETSNKNYSGTLQVALRVIPEDLEAILGIHEQRTVILDDNKETDKIIVDYLWKTFRVRSESKKQVAMQWLGKEVKHSAAWLYFELDVNNAQSLTLENRVLMDYKDSQTNRAQVKINGKSRYYTFTVQDKPKLLL